MAGNDKAPIVEQNSTVSEKAGVGFYDKLFTALILIDINPIVCNLVFTQKLFAAAAIRTPMGSVYGDCLFRHIKPPA